MEPINHQALFWWTIMLGVGAFTGLCYLVSLWVFVGWLVKRLTAKEHDGERAQS